MAAQARQDFNMDSTSQQSFCRFFKNLPEKPNSTIRFFSRLDYYTLHGSDALFAAQEVFNTTSACKKIGAEPNTIDSLLLNKNHFESFVRNLLLVKQYRVEVYVNQGSVRGNTKNHDWIVEYRGSPGNLAQFEDLIFNDYEVAATSAVMAVKISTEGSSKVVGVSVVNVLESSISVSEFKDEETLAELESLIVTLAPKECLVIQASGDNPDFQNLKQLLERNNVLLTARKKAEFNNDSLIQDLNFLIKFKKGQQRNVQALPETNLPLAMSSTGALIKYLDLMGDESYSNQFELKEIERSRYVRLDSAAIKALNIEPRADLPNSETSTFSSILTLLDKCKTSQGKRLLSQWVRQPLKDLSLIQERHEIVEALLDNYELRTILSDDFLKRVPDLQQLSKKLMRKKAGLLECYKVYQCMNNLPVMVEKLDAISNVTAVKANVIDPLIELFKEMDPFQKMVEQTIDLNAADRGDFFVKAEFDPELEEIKTKMDEQEEKIQKQLSRVADDLSLEAGKTVKLELNSQYGYHFRITLKDEKTLRNNKNYTILDSLKGGVRFTNQKVDDLNKEYLQSKTSYTSEQKKVVAEIINTAAGYVASIRNIGERISFLDILNSFAVAAAFAPKTYVKPKMLPSDAGELTLIQARHPCLEMLEQHNYIPNDINLDKGTRFYIVTGPNMGGKSTYIRSVGVVALMAHIGSFVPCDKATISLLDSILARIGADDSQIKGLSTFMAEMVETSQIIKTATCNSLVIIDELGRGTSTYDGCGIAWAIAEHLAKVVKSYCLFATHFHEITRLAEDVDTVKNYHVTAQLGDKLILLYKVLPGICDQSFGIHVAKMANFPEDVIEFAKKKQAELEDLQGIVFEGSDDSVKKNKIIDEGHNLMAEFAKKCKNLDKTMSDEDLMKKVSCLKEEILALNNPYISALLTKS